MFTLFMHICYTLCYQQDNGLLRNRGNNESRNLLCCGEPALRSLPKQHLAAVTMVISGRKRESACRNTMNATLYSIRTLPHQYESRFYEALERSNGNQASVRVIQSITSWADQIVNQPPHRFIEATSNRYKTYTRPSTILVVMTTGSC